MLVVHNFNRHSPQNMDVTLHRRGMLYAYRQFKQAFSALMTTLSQLGQTELERGGGGGGTDS